MRRAISCMLATLVILSAPWAGGDAIAGGRIQMRYVSRVDPMLAIANPNLPILVQGRVMAIDRETPLTYANIFVPGTSRGTMAILDGYFWLRGLEPGAWTIEARYLSYESGIAPIEVRPGDVVEIEFWLAVDPLRFDTFQVKAERRLLVREETGTARRLSSDEIDNLPMDGVVEMVALQPGVVLENNEIHIRGGRSDDTSFLVDGIGVSDPLAAGRYGASFNADLINEIEVLTGGFSAEYGQAVSGVVNVSTKEGSDEFEGKLTYKTDEFAPEASYYNTDNFRVTLSGPNLIWDQLKAIGLPLPGEQSFIVSASSNLSNTHLPTESLTGALNSAIIGDAWSPRAQNEWSGLAKLTWRFDPTRKLNLHYSNQQDIGLGYFLPAEGFPRKYQNILDAYNVFATQNILAQANWLHVLGESTSYELRLGRQFSRMHSNKNGSDDFGQYLGPETNDIPIQTESEIPLFYTAGAHVGGDADRWHDHFSDSWIFKGDYSWVPNETNQFKAGFEYTYSEIQLIDLQGNLDTPPPGFLSESQDIFFAHPHVLAGYVQDRVDYRGLIFNAGLRLDAWAPGREVDEVMANPQDYIFIFDELAQSYADNTYELFGRRWKARLSPRLGLSFPISDRDKFFFSYGHFNQWPKYNYVYAQLQTDFSTALQLLGNPNLDPKVTIQYETGVQHEFDNLWSAGITFYSNDIFGYAQAVILNEVAIDPADTPDPDDTTVYLISPVRYFNADAARSLGVELHIEKRTTRWLSGRLSFELQRSTGTNSQADATFLAAELNQANPDYEAEEGIRNAPLLWDRPWSATLNFNFFVPDELRPHLFGWRPPGNWSANLLYRVWAGARYTERILQDDGNVVSSRNTFGELGPYRSSVDVKLRKWFDLPAGQRFTLFFEGRNIFDSGNYRRVNPWTGLPYHRGNWDGDLAAQRLNGSPRTVNTVEYAEDYVDPSYRTDPRTILMGVSWEW